MTECWTILVVGLSVVDDGRCTMVDGCWRMDDWTVDGGWRAMEGGR